MPGAPDPLYVAARRTLLDALEAVREHLDAVVLVGAQAVYIHTGAGELAVAPYTTDGDLAIDPARLSPEPRLEELLAGAGFSPSASDVGAWEKQVPVGGTARVIVVDLLVPDSLGGPGRRAARIPPHHKRTARKVLGLEGALVDRDIHRMGALDPGDARVFDVSVAGPAALLVAKVFKIRDRVDDPGRETDKDALDVLRLLQAVPTQELVRRLEVLKADERSRAVTVEALERLPDLFGSRRAIGCVMAARAAAPLEPEERITASAAVLAQDLLQAVGEESDRDPEL